MNVVLRREREDCGESGCEEVEFHQGILDDVKIAWRSFIQATNALIKESMGKGMFYTDVPGYTEARKRLTGKIRDAIPQECLEPLVREAVPDDPYGRAPLDVALDSLFYELSLSEAYADHPDVRAWIDEKLYWPDYSQSRKEGGSELPLAA